MIPNVKRLTIVIAALLLAGLTVHGVHLMQQGRRVEVLVRALERARAGNDPQMLIASLKRYLAVRPEDREAKKELLVLELDHATTADHFVDVYYQLKEYVQRNTQDIEMWQHAVTLALQLEKYADVKSHLENLAAHRELTPQMLVWKATSQHKLGDVEGAIKTYRSAIEKDPALIQAYVDLATILRRNLEAVDESQYWIRKLTEANPQLAAAHLAQARYYFQQADLPAALASVEASLAQEGSKTEGVLLWSDIVSMMQQQAARSSARSWQQQDDEIAARLQSAWDADPAEARFAVKLAAFALKRENPTEAERLLRKGLEQAPDNAMLTWELADLKITLGHRDEAQRLITELTAAGVRRGLTEYLRGRLLMQDQRWQEAVKAFNSSRSEIQSSERLAAQADIYLADCYAQLGDDDQRLTVARRAVQTQPFFVAARQSLSQALLAVGRVDEALVEYRTLLDLPDAPAYGWTAEIGWAAVAKVLIIRNLSIPESERHWEDMDPVLESLAEAAPDTIEVALLRAEVLASQSRVDEAREVLEGFQHGGPEDVRWWVARINLALREANLDSAEKLLQEALQHMGKQVELRLIEARLAVYRSEEGHTRLAEIADETTDWPATDRVRLLYELAAFYHSMRRTDDAQRMYDEIIKLTPQDIRVWLCKFDISINREEYEACEEQVKAMQKIEGREGSYALLAESLLILRRQDSSRSQEQIDKARRTLTQLQVRRPRWARVQWAFGSLEEIEGRRDRAADFYLKAFDYGDRSPELVRRTLNLLQAMHRYGEAEELIHRWEQTPNAPILPEINRMAAEISLERQNPEQALMRAFRAVSKSSTDYHDHLWLAQIHRSGGDLESAEEALRTAVRLAPQATETWVALINHLQREERPAEARLLIERIQAEAPLAQQPVILANCLEVLGRIDDAEREFLRAVEQAPGDLKLLESAAEFFRRIRKISDSERLWRRLLSLSADRPVVDRCQARRGLASILAYRGDYAGFREALSLVEQNLKDLPRSTIDLRAKSTLLALRGDPAQRRESAELFAKLAREEPLTIKDQSVLANLHEVNGELTKAHDIWQMLVANQNTNPTYLARYVSVLLKRNARSDAVVWLERLRTVAPDWKPTLELQAELWLPDGRIQEVINLFLEHVEQPGDATQQTRRVVESAEALERLARTYLRGDNEGRAALVQAAEELFRRYVKLDPTKQHVLAGFLARTNRPVESLQLFNACWESAPPPVISSLMASSLPLSDPSMELIGKAIDSITEHLPNPVPVSMLNDLGVLEEKRQRFDQAEEYYRRAISYEPENVVAMNNLAFLLALENRKIDEATKLIDKALSLAGPSPALLDTRAQVALTSGKLDAAKSDREAVVREAPTAAAWFRLAIVYQQLNDKRKLREAAVKARNSNVSPIDVHFLERRHLDGVLKIADNPA